MKKIKTPSKRYTSFLITETKLYVAKLSAKGTEFVSFFEMTFPAGVITGGEERNREGVTHELLTVKKQMKLKDRFVVVGIPETKATTHTLTLPMLAPDEVEQAIVREAPTFLPFAANDEYIDWMQIAKLPGEQQKILISGVPKTVIDGFSQAFLAAGLSPVAFETTSISLFQLLPEPARELSLMTEIGEFGTIHMLVTEGSIEVSSVIPDNENVFE